jgi:hypothetical protein
VTGVDRETDAVAAFMRSQQRRILTQAITDLSAASIDDLPATTHRIAGTLGTYGLASAYDAVSGLQRALSADADEAAIEQGRAATLGALDVVLDHLPEGGP